MTATRTAPTATVSCDADGCRNDDEREKERTRRNDLDSPPVATTGFFDQVLGRTRRELP
jgi:hypothetical protein